MHNLLSEMRTPVTSSSKLYIDNQSAIQVAKNPQHHGRMKHLDLRYYWLRHTVAAGVLSLHYLPTAEMPADLCTKALGRIKVAEARAMMGLFLPS